VIGPDEENGDQHWSAITVRSIAGREVAFDGEGFFRSAEDWTEEIALVLAGEDGLEELSEAQWRVIRFLREYYFQNGRAPLNRQLKLGVGLSLLDLEGLFPGGIKHGARRLAGLPNPKTCA